MKIKFWTAGFLCWLLAFPLAAFAQVTRQPRIPPQRPPEAAQLARLRREIGQRPPFAGGLQTSPGNITIAKVAAPDDATLRAIADRAAGLVMLAAEKAAAHASDPRGFPLPAGAGALENVFFRHLQRLTPAQRNATLRRAGAFFNEPSNQRLRRYGDLAKIDLRSPAPIVEQVKAGPAPRYSSRLTRERLEVLARNAARVKMNRALRPNLDPRLPQLKTVPLQRYYSVTNHDHLFTADQSELGCGRYGQMPEGVAAHLLPAPQMGAVPLYRWVSSNLRNHVFALDDNNSPLKMLGYRPEKIAGYVYAQAAPGRAPIHWYYRQQLPGMSPMFAIPNFGNDHFYTLTRDDAGLAPHGYSYRGVLAYAFAEPRGETTYARASRLEFYLDSFVCADDTDEAGQDEMTIGGIATKADGETFRLPNIKLGDFTSGQLRDFNPPRFWAAFDVNEGTEYPKTYFVTSVLVENDNGGFSEFMEDIYNKVKEYVSAELAAAVGASIGATGTFVGAIIGAAVGYAVGKAFAALKSWWEDEIYAPTPYQITVLSNEAANGSETVCGTDSWTRYDSNYYLAFHWRLGN